ncbi:hypothetical protein QJS66_06990 [Kocuria rhizophila]|nr:hypothetical protein QJS66_06990 [Kocuria rhizophila]
MQEKLDYLRNESPVKDSPAVRTEHDVMDYGEAVEPRHRRRPSSPTTCGPRGCGERGGAAPESTAICWPSRQHLDAQHDDGPVARSVFTCSTARAAFTARSTATSTCSWRVAGAFGGCASALRTGWS